MKSLDEMFYIVNDTYCYAHGGAFVVYKGTFQIDNCMEPLIEEVLEKNEIVKK
jgi:hypothetical protein